MWTCSWHSCFVFGSSQVQISVWRRTVLPAFCTVFLSSSKEFLNSRGRFFYHHTSAVSSHRKSTLHYLQLGHATSFHITSFLRHYLLFLQLFNSIQSELLTASKWSGLVMHSGPYTCGHHTLMTSNVHCLVTRYAVSSVSSTFPHFFAGKFHAEFWNMWSVPLNVTCSSLHPRVATRVPTERR
jgi:hypothetical protein